MTRGEVNAPIDPPLNREQVNVPTGAFAVGKRPDGLFGAGSKARRFTRRLFRPCL
jgi:hypothetical protein